MPSCQVPWYLGHLAPSPLASWLCQEPSPWPPWRPWRHEIPEMRHVHQMYASAAASFEPRRTLRSSMTSGSVHALRPINASHNAELLAICTAAGKRDLGLE